MSIQQKWPGIFLLGIICAANATAQLNRTASGVVSSGDGLTLRGVAVSLSRLPKEGPPQIYSTATDNQGRFEVKGIEPGVYAVCILPRAGNYLNSCVWQPRQEIDVTAGNASSQFTLERGTRLAVWVRDPTGILSKTDSRSNQPAFLVADARGTIREILSASKEGGGVTRYSTVVPFSQNFTVTVQANGLRLSAMQGEVVSTSSNRAVASRQVQEIVVEDFTLVP